MPRDLYEVAKELAEEVVVTARCAGYEIEQSREMFFRSDVLDLASTIADWIDNHMSAAA